MKHKYLALAAMAAAPLLMPTEALADRCKQYTKTIRIDGVLEVGVGKACERRGGDWEIVSLKGPREIQYRMRDHIYDDLYGRGYRVLVVNNYGYPSSYHRHYAPRVVYYTPRPRGYGFAYNAGYHHGSKHKHYKKKHYDRHDNRGHHGKRGKHGKGHKKHH